MKITNPFDTPGKEGGIIAIVAIPKKGGHVSWNAIVDKLGLIPATYTIQCWASTMPAFEMQFSYPKEDAIPDVASCMLLPGLFTIADPPYPDWERGNMIMKMGDESERTPMPAKLAIYINQRAKEKRRG